MKNSGIPKLHVVVTRKPNVPQLEWAVMLIAADAQGNRALGYRGTGTILDAGAVAFESGPEVHDENLPRWTTMNSTDRPDIRAKIIDLAKRGAKALAESGTDKFERLIE